MRTDHAASIYTQLMNIRPLLQTAKNIWLSTHKSADGDGLGSEVALYHALKSLNFPVKIIHNDQTPERYNFLLTGIEIIDATKVDQNIFTNQDVALIFDTHDPKLCSPFFEYLQSTGCKVIFIDHHVVFEKKIQDITYHINENASCTGEITLDLIKNLGVKLNPTIASALYTSLLFDTQSFKLQRDSLKVFAMAQELIQHGANHSQIYHYLFDNWTISKMNYLSKLISEVRYKDNEIAIISISKVDLKEFNLTADDVSDLVDLFMLVKNLESSIVIREEAYNYYKLSFRSRSYEVLSWAREFGGGGHLYSAGAWVHDSEENIIKKIHGQIENKKSIAI